MSARQELRPCDHEARAHALRTLREAVAVLLANPLPHRPELWINTTADNTLCLGTEPATSHDTVDILELLVPYIEAEREAWHQKRRIGQNVRRWLRELEGQS